MKFKKGDKVKFKSNNSLNTQYFKHGLTNLEIKYELKPDLYNVYESNKKTAWIVKEYELEFDIIKKWKELI